MKNVHRAIKTALLAGALAWTVFALATPRAEAGTSASTVPTTINGQVQHNLLTLPWYGTFDNIEYQVTGSEVILSGEVISEHSQTKNDAENAVKGIPGVTRVVNNIEVLPPSTFDAQIRRAEYRAIFSRADLGRYTMGANPPVHIIVKNGDVTLEGVVMNQMDKTIAGIAANSVPNVFSVTNNLRIG